MTRKIFLGQHSNTVFSQARRVSSHLGPLLLWLIALSGILRAAGDIPPASQLSAVLESSHLKIETDCATGRWSLLDKRAGVRWPTEGTCSWGQLQPPISDGFDDCQTSDTKIVLSQKSPAVQIAWELIDAGRRLRITAEGLEQMRLLEEMLVVSSDEQGHVIVPCREGLLISAQRGATFERSFGTSDYEGCHMNMLGLLKSGSALIVDWDDAYVTAELRGAPLAAANGSHQIVTRFHLRRTAHELRLTPLGRGDWNTVAAGYRRLAEQRGTAVTLQDKIRRDPHAERMIGASNFKLWTCLARRMNEESTEEESVTVHWTFEEAAQIAEHLRHDLEVDRCLFMLGGWTEGGYDCRHPDNLPANPECGGNEQLAAAIERIQQLGYVGSLHDNYQDLYRDAPSWDPALVEKHSDGTLVQGGRWLGGRAYMVCAPNQFKMAMRPQNLPAIQQLFHPWSYFIDTTYAVGPRECADPHHALDRNEDIAWKIRLSDAARQQFGLFGSECGREWALPHSDFFEGLVGVAGKYFHNLDPASLGATVIPFWEMVYHDCQVCYGKYGYAADQAAEYVAHHILCARPLHYHSIPDHLYWKKTAPATPADGSLWVQADQGWAAGRHPLDIFLKNTHEVLGPLHAATAHQRLTELQFLTDDRSVRQATYGNGPAATHVWVNLGEQTMSVKTRFGGEVVLPPFGFVVEGPRLVAFLAISWNGKDYEEPTLFAIQPQDDQPLDDARRVRIYHGRGGPDILWKQREFSVDREETVTVDSR